MLPNSALKRFGSWVLTWTDAPPADYGAAVKGGGSLTTDGTNIYGLEGNNKNVFKSYNPATDTWSAKANVGAAVNPGGGLIYVAGTNRIYAINGGGKNTIYEYSIGANTWTKRANCPKNISTGGAITSDGQYVYVLIGNNTTSFYRYDPAANTWLARAVTPGKIGDGGALVRVGNYLYATQGGTAVFYRYDIANNTWTTMTAAPGSFDSGAALTAVGNTIYALRGNGNGTDREFYRYNLLANTWTTDTSTLATLNTGGALLNFGSAQSYETAVDPSPAIVLSGNNVTVTYTVTASETVSSFTPPASLTVSVSNSAVATQLAGPAPAGPVNLAANTPTTFSYTYQIAAGTPPSGVTFSVPQRTSGTSAALPGGVVWPASSAHNVLAVPTLTMQAEVVAMPTNAIVNNVATFSGADKKNLDFCYVVADGSGAGTDNDLLLKITEDGTVAQIGPLGTTRSEALVFSPDYAKLYTTDRDPAIGAGSDRFGSVNLATGVFTPISRLASSANLISGFLPTNVAASFSVLDVRGLSFDPFDGKLYAIGRRDNLTVGDTNLDLLFVIDPGSGQHVNNTFGTGRDYLPIRTDLLATKLYNVTDLAFRPGTELLYAIANDTVTSTNNGDHLVTINLTSGIVTDLGRISLNGTNIDNVQGLTFTPNGSLHATVGGLTGQGGATPPTYANTYLILDPATGQASLTGLVNLHPITESGTNVFDFGGVACYSDDVQVSGTDNAITSLKGTIGDLVWADINGNGTNEPVFNVLDGRLDFNMDGAANASDNGVFGSIRVIGGYLDMNRDSAISAADNGSFLGKSVLGGYLDMNANGFGSVAAPEATDDGTLLAERGIPSVRVYVDANTNNVLDWTDLNGNGVWETGEGEPWAKTDSFGGYYMYGFTASTNRVRVDGNTAPTGYLPTTAPTVFAVLTNDNAQFLEADFGLRPNLQPNDGLDSSIGDLVWVDRNGNGIYDTGDQPLTNVTVKLYLDLDHNDSFSAGDVQIGAIRTGANGSYLFTGLTADTYFVQVDTNSAAFPAGLALTTNSPAPTNPAKVVLPVAFESLTNDFAFNYTSAIGDLVWYDNNGNGLYEPGLGEHGVPNAFVMLLLDANGDGLFDGLVDYQVQVARTDTNGAYLLAHLPPNTYFVQVYEQSVIPEGCVSNCQYTLLPTTPTRVLVPLAVNQTFLAADFGFKNGSFIEGTVFWDVNHDGVYEPTLPGSPETGLPSITVWLDANGDGVLNWTDGNSNGVWDAGEGEQWTVTDASGEYKFFVTQIGTYLVRYHTTDPDIPAALQGVPAETTPTSQFVNISVLGEERSGIDFGRDNAGKVGDLIFGDRGTSGTYEGSATDPGLSGVVVELYFDTDNSGNFDPGNDSYVATTTATDGSYLFPGLPDGTYFVKVLGESLPAAWQSTPTVDPTGALDGIGMAILTGGSADLTMDFGFPPAQPGSIAGTVFNDGGAAVGDGELNANLTDGIVDLNRDGVTNTLDDGTLFGYAIIDGWVDVDGDETNTVADLVSDGSFGGMNVTNGVVFNPGGASFTGTLSADSRLPGVTLNLRDSSGALLRTTVTDASGNYRFDGVKPGNYTVAEINPIGFDTVLDRAGNPTNELTNLDTTDDLIPVTVSAGGTSAQNNFLDDSPDNSTYLVAIAGQVRNDTDADGNFADPDSGLTNVVVRLFADLNGDGLTPLLNVMDGLIDLDRDGILTARDSGTLFGLPILSGQVDVNNDGVITAADALMNFNGFGVIAGQLDMNGSGTITTADDGTFPVEPLLATTLTAANGTYSFTNLPFSGYVVVETDPTSAYSTADVVGLNDNQIGVVLSYGGKSGRDFLDALPATVSGHLYEDTNGNGIQDGFEPSLVGVDILIQESGGDLTTVTTDANGNWTNTVPPGATVATVIISDPQFLAVFPNGHVQTDGTDPSIGVAVGGVNTFLGNDGYFKPTGGTGSIAGTVFNDTDLNGFGGADVPVPGVVVDLYVDTDGNHLVPFYNVIGGLIDANGSGTITSADDATILDYAILDGFVDLDGNGTITAADNGYFNGIPVYAGKLDLNRDGTVNVSDNGSVAGEPRVVQDVTVSNGTYLFTNLPTANYVVVERDPAGATSVDDRAAVTEFEGAAADSQIGVVLSASEQSVGNDFLDRNIATYAISGTVWNDTDNTSTFSAGDTRIAIVAVALYGDLNGDGWLSPTELAAGAIATTLTDLAGNYTFAGLPSGNYVVVETDPSGATSITDIDGTLLNGPNAVAVTLSNASVTGRDFLDGGVPLSRIGDFVWTDTNGDGLQDGGEPGLVGVTVVLYDTNLTVLATNISGTDGAYALSNLPPGSYVVRFLGPSGYNNTLPNIGANDAIDSDVLPTSYAGTYNLTSGQTNLTVDAGFYQPASVSGKVLVDLNANGTQDGGETTGIANVTITLKTNGVTVTTTTTDASGNYSFTNLPPGSYTVLETDLGGLCEHRRHARRQ